MSDHTAILNRVLGNFCAVHAYHYPKPLRTVRHHIWPHEYGGPTSPENLVLICDTGHYNVHECLDLLIAGDLTLSVGTRKEQALARQGYAAMQAAKA